VGVSELKWKLVKFENVDQGISGGHWDMDEKLDVFWQDIVGDLNLE
jgi:hypothetical protein